MKEIFILEIRWPIGREHMGHKTFYCLSQETAQRKLYEYVRANWSEEAERKKSRLPKSMPPGSRTAIREYFDLTEDSYLFESRPLEA